ncbi:hypothetical protein LSAT2_012836 [Lamellibrachia satsuma]|nr:hypothetical protein LSAT2_012836 [Lamellibrachia satsuma]
MAILSRRRNRIYVFVAVIAGYVLCLATYPAFHSYLQERGALGNVVSDQLLKTSEEKNHKKYNNGGGGWTHNSDIHKEEKAKDERTNASDIYDISQNAALLDTDNLVANVVMYVWCGKRMFEFQHYLSVRSVLRNIRPDVIWFYKVHEPLVGKNSYNTWLSDIREGFPFFRSTSVSPVACVSSTGRPDASWVRKALRKHGGMYASENTIFVRPHIDLRKHAGFTTVDKNMDGFEIANGGRPGTAQQTPSFRAKMCIAEDAYGPNEVTALCVNRNGSSLHPDDIWQLDSAFGRLARLLAYGDAKFSVPTPHDKTGRDYKRVTNRPNGAYGAAALEEALNALQQGESYRSVEREYGVPRRTLQRHHKDQVRAPGRIQLGRFRQILDSDVESIIAEHALDMQQRIYGLSLNEIRRMAFEIAERHGLSHPFDKTKKMAGRHWLNGFLDRNNTLSVREPEMTSICRAVGFNKVQVDKFFGIWRALLEDLGEIDGSRLWNMDESGLTAVHKPGRIIAKKGQKQVGKITSGERGKTVTILCSINAHGRHSPPFMIFPRKNMNDHLLLGSPPGTVGVPTDSGWTDSGWTDSGWECRRTVDGRTVRCS